MAMTDNDGERSQSERDYARPLEHDIRDRTHASARARHRRPPAPGVIIAILIIGLGVLLFLDNFGLFHIYNVWRFWSVALIAVGFSKMFGCRGAGGRVWAGIMIAAGVLFLLNSLRIFHVGWHLIWPLALVGIGIIMLVNSLARKSIAERCVTTSSGDASTGDTLREWVIFGGLKKRLDTPNFQGGEMIAVFGGIEVDLRRANIVNTTKEVVIDANATFGGIEVKVPETWRVITRGLGIFGGYEDKTIPPRAQDGVTAPTVVVTGYAIFGGVAVQN
jgi:predicted membrane protein